MRQLLLEVVPAVVASGAEATSWTDAVSASAAVAGAVFALGTLIVAVLAARYAKGQVDGARAQLEEARTLRREQAQPYVVVYAELNAASKQFVDLVVTNLGSTGAHDIRIASSPPLTRSDDGGVHEAVELPEVIPFLAPGQQWRTFWDSGIDRARSSLPDRYDVTATYADARGALPGTPSVLDWNVFRQRMFIEEKTVHHVAKSLSNIDKALAKWTKANDVVRVATYDGKGRDAQRAAQRQQHHQWIDKKEAREASGDAPRRSLRAWLRAWAARRPIG